MDTVIEMLEKTAEKFPERIAFSDADNSISWKELKEKSRMIGCRLRRYMYDGCAVAFYLEKSVKSVQAMFGVVSAGGFYSYVDVRQPIRRVADIFSTLEPSVVISDEHNMENALDAVARYGVPVTVLNINELFTYLDPVEGMVNERNIHYMDNVPLYVNFTSGSTGNPKGVAVSHRNVIDFITHFTEVFGFKETDILGNQAPFDFDVSVKDIYTALLTGAQVVLIPRDYFTKPAMLMDYLNDHNVTTLIWAVSAMCFVSGMGGFEYKIPGSINRVFFSGEVMPIKHLNCWMEKLPRAVYVNLYGPTEITCNCTYKVLETRKYEMNESLPIGISFPNEDVFLLDDKERLVTADKYDVTGEICVKGSCVGLGYYNNPKLSTSSFVQNPLHNKYREIIYRTGDLGRYDAHGELHYVARKDSQIKHMGHRIELGEIENVANSYNGVIRSCCVYQSENSRLALFFVGDAEQKALKENLKKDLPRYMVPEKIMKLDSLPLNAHGKIDRKALQGLLKENKNIDNIRGGEKNE